MENSVKVVVRFRAGERGDLAPWRIERTLTALQGKDHEFSFDAVLGPNETQEELYNSSSRDTVTSLYLLHSMGGFNATIFAYGQSVNARQGSGKTFSMLGPESVTEVLVNRAAVIPPETQMLYGIIPRTTFHMFELINQGIAQSTQFLIKCSYIEIYNEQINDLLVNPPAENLRMREFPNLGMCVVGMTEKFIATPEEVFDCLSLGTANRIVCATGQNARSSRSHTVFILVVEQKLLDGSSKISKLNLVDLAGSEKLSKTGAEGQALKEAQNINLSLTTLGRCISALTSAKKEHIPFRESKLTMILKESLGGNSKTALICTASQKEVHKEEAITTLKFAERAKLIQNKAQSNVSQSPEQMRIMIDKLKKEVSELKQQLSGQPASVDGPFSHDDYRYLYEELQTRFTDLQVNSERELEAFRQQLEQADRKASQSVDALAMHEEIMDYKDQIDDTNKRLATEQEQASLQRLQYQENMRELQLQIETVQRDLAVQKAEFLSTQQLLAAAREEIQSKDGALDQQQTKARTLQEELSSLKSSFAQLEDKVGSSTRTLENSEKALTAATRSKAQLEAEISTLRGNFEQLRIQHVTLELEHSQLQRESQELSRESQDQRELWERQMIGLQRQLAETLSKEESLALQQSSREEMALQVKAAHDHQSATAEELKQEKARLQKAVKSLKLAEMENSRLQSAVETLKADISLRDQLVQDAQSQIQQFSTEATEAQRHFRLEQSAREALENKLSAQIVEAQKVAAEAEQRRIQETTQLQASLNALKAELASVKKVVSQRDTESAKFALRIKTLEDEKVKLEAKIKQLDNSLKKQNKETADLRKNSVFSQVQSRGNRGSVISSQVKVNSSMYGGVVLKKTGNKFLRDAMEEAERARQQAPETQYKVFYGAADISSLYSHEEDYDEPRSSGSSSSSSEEEEKVEA
jgi:kinesin family protein 5